MVLGRGHGVDYPMVAALLGGLLALRDGMDE